MEKYDTNGYIHTYIRSYTHTQRDKQMHRQAIIS